MLHRPCRATALAAAALLVAGCTTVDLGNTPGPPVPAPVYRVGDRWVYHVVDGYRTRIEWDETHEVTAIDAQGITVKVSVKGPAVDVERTERWSAPGIVLQGALYEAETDRFDPPLVRYRFPLTPGESWSERVRDLDKPPGPYGPITRQVSVGGHERITTPAGSFDAIGMRAIMQLDDETFWRWPTECDYTVWYAPAAGAAVRERRRSHWIDKGGPDGAGSHPGQYAEIELISFSHGR